MDLIKSGRYMYIDIFYAKTCATTKISTVAGYYEVLATLLLQTILVYFEAEFDSNYHILHNGKADLWQ